MKKEKLEGKQQDWRRINMQRAREARMRKLREKKEQEAIQKIDDLALTIDDKVEKEIAAKVETMLKETDPKQLKSDFFKVFYEVGGVKGMVNWIKNNRDNRKEYYKMLVNLLKSETHKQQQSQAQQVVLNIITPDQKKEFIIDGSVTESGDEKEGD